MTKQTVKEREDFYLDAFEMLNKPRRIFQGLEINAKRQVKDYSPEELDLVLDMIKEAKLDFYAVTLPKFEKRVNELNKMD